MDAPRPRCAPSSALWAGAAPGSTSWTSTGAAEPMPEVVVGRLVRAHGLTGEIAVDVRTDEPDRRFARGTVVTLRRPQAEVPLPHTLPASLTVGSTRWHQHRLLVRFDELEDRSAAEAVRGLLLVADLADDARPEDPEEFYDHQLVGLRVHTTDG